MNYKEISDKWKVFLAENAFKEDIVIKPEKKKKKEIIVSEEDNVNEYEELEEMSAMSGAGGGDVQGFASKLDDEE